MLTLCTFVSCSEVSILCGSQQTWRCPKPHMQFLPQHRGGNLSRSVVGHFWDPVVSIYVNHSKIPLAYWVQVAPDWIQQRCNHLAGQDPLKSRLRILKCKWICLYCSLFPFCPSPALCLIGIRSLPANGRNPPGEALSGTARLWETALLLLSISTAT